MKKKIRLISMALLLVSMICMFLPIAKYEDHSADSLSEDIAKQEDKLQRAKDKYDRYVSGGKDADTLAKQQKQVDKEQAKLDELIAQQSGADGSKLDALHFSLLPGKLPEQLALDQQVINNYGLYRANFDSFYPLIWAAFLLLAATLALEFAAGDKYASRLYTFASFTNLIAILLIGFTLLRIGGMPIKLPYSNAIVNPFVACALIALPVVTLSMNAMNQQGTKKAMIYVLCIFFSLLSIVPFWIMIVNATRSTYEIQQGVSLLPGSSLLNNWHVLQTKNFDIKTGFINSAIISFGATILSVYFSALTAYGLTVYRFKGRNLAFAIVMGIIMIPAQVTSTGFYIFMYQLGWVNSYLPLIIPSIAAASTVFFFRQYLEANFQISLVEAGRIDGAGEFYIYNTIILPIMVPAMATMGIMAVIASWNDYLRPLMLLTNPNMKTLPMMVKELRGDIYRTEFGSIYLGLSLTALPLLAVYFAFSKYIIAGVALGGVKE